MFVSRPSPPAQAAHDARPIDSEEAPPLQSVHFNPKPNRLGSCPAPQCGNPLVIEESKSEGAAEVGVHRAISERAQEPNCLSVN